MKKLLLILCALLCLAGSAHAQVTAMPFIKSQWFDNNGVECSGCLLYTYTAGTSSPLITYSDALGTTPNTNPIVLDSAGRASVFLTATAYKFVLTLPSATQLWSIDNITTSNITLISSNNIWLGTNTWTAVSTFNGTAAFNVGLTSTGPNTLNGGGTLAGTWGGSPTFSGTPTFSGGFVSTTGSFSGQITSTVSTGTAPFVIASTTNVPNLNASSVNGCTFPIPCPIGSTTPNTGVFTTLQANTSLTLPGSSALTGVSGNGVKVATAGTMTGAAGTTICNDGSGNVVSTGCVAGHVISLGTNSSVCSTNNSAGNTCTTNVNLSPTQADTAYIANCNGITNTGYPFIIGLSKSTTQITVTISNGSASQAVISTFAELDCSAIHP